MSRNACRSLALASLLAVALAPAVSRAQTAAEKPKASSNIISLYQCEAGKHVEFLKWMAQQEAVAKEAGAPATAWYYHTDGASWDFAAITPQLEPAKQAELDAKVEAISKKKGIPTGFHALLQFRQFMGTHTDTFAMGPHTAEELVKMAEKKD